MNRTSTAVLVAIAIPVFTGQLENARESADAANIRSAYAEVASKALEDPTHDQTATIKLEQAQDGWQNKGITDIAGVPTSASKTENGKLGATNDQSVEIKYTASTGKFSIGGIEAKGTSVSTGTTNNASGNGNNG